MQDCVVLTLILTHPSGHPVPMVRDDLPISMESLERQPPGRSEKR